MNHQGGGELPTITKAMYGSSTLTGYVGPAEATLTELAQHVNAINKQRLNLPLERPVPIIKENQVTARIVRVFIADPNESLPLEKRLIYKSEEKLTDLTDQELFFEANPADLLKRHNEYRVAVPRKGVVIDGKAVMLEPARIRDLKMVVVDVAQF